MKIPVEGRKEGVCDRTNDEQTSYEACFESVRGLWERENNVQGGYKAWPK